MKRLKALLGAAVTAIVLAGPASAQPTPIDVAANATWMHDTAKVRFPPEIDGFRRSRVQDFGDQRLDVGATYFEESSGTTATGSVGPSASAMKRPNGPVATASVGRSTG